MKIEDTSSEDLADMVRNGLDNNEPCWCGDPTNEGGCPACDAGIVAQKAFAELMKRMGVEE